MRSKVLAGVALLAMIGAGEALLSPATAQGAAVEAAARPAVQVSVSNVTSHQGFILAALYDEANWGGAAASRVRVPVSGDVVTFRLSAPSPGRYGIRLFHDVDSDGALNTNFVGMPTEPFGFSNNAPLQFGPPSFAAAAFDLGEGGAVQTIALR